MKTITISTTAKASLQTVWNAYTQPEHITQWNFASDYWHCPNASVELKEGGKYIARMEAKDGSYGFDFSARFDEIIPFQKIVYTLDDNRKVSTLFEQIGDKIIITTHFDAENSNPIDMQQAGWQAILNNFKRYTENISSK